MGKKKVFGLVCVCVLQEVGETKTELQKDLILGLHLSVGQKHESKWMLMLLYFCWLCKGYGLLKFAISNKMVIMSLLLTK